MLLQRDPAKRKRNQTTNNQFFREDRSEVKANRTIIWGNGRNCELDWRTGKCLSH